MRTIFGDIKNIFISRLSSKLLVSTDNLIISSFISVSIVGRYANYSLITQSVSNIMVTLSSAIQPSIGNMFTEENQEKNYQVLRQITFVFFLLASFCSASLMALMTRFVTDFWLTPAYVLSTNIVICCVINCYFFIISLPTAMMMTVSGMFDNERNISVLYAITNLVISLLLVKPLGVTGILLGTFASYLVQIIFRIRIFFRNYLQKSCTRYIADMLQYLLLAALETVVTYFAVNMLYPNGGLIKFILSMVVCVLLPNGINLVIFLKSWRLQSITNMIKELRPNK